ncbi:PREDICTED: pancreatic progenitor cell differentiation and proliferation factor-like protein [Miniopterus natalensis]|uniref:pancreatic progenitor cell differentiation and proliferation factor-like protein n=1 Tax=Miniopterus natalensis TaxID=291302 RepID=UPI0007A6D372|nr:PREDICTED: pancreatic progenitor cell differentiation and proliferation factor-like protein [Miniopterus natalensis]
MASVPSIGCLLAKNQYYRKASVSSLSSDGLGFADEGDKRPPEGLPEMAEPTWWLKSFFHADPVLSDVIRKELCASGTNC